MSGGPSSIGEYVDRSHSTPRRVLVIDVGGTSVKVLATGQTESRSFRSGPTLTPRRMVSRVKKLVADWAYDVVSIGYPGAVLHGCPIAEPHNLARGWVGFDFAQAFGCPVKVVNDAALQALGCYEGGKMLFLGLGTGLGSAIIVEGILEPMELAHLPYKKTCTSSRLCRCVVAWMTMPTPSSAAIDCGRTCRRAASAQSRTA
jgi:ROK family protein